MKGRLNTLTKLQWLIWLVLFWMLFFYAMQDYPLSDSFNYAIHSTVTYALIIYGNALWLMPRLYAKKKYWLYGVIVLLVIIALTYVRTQTQAYIYYKIILHQPYKLTFHSYAYTFILYCLFFIFSMAFRYTLDFFQIKQQQEQLMKQHAEAQLNLLKAQVQPHFLFNTLNNIYYVAQRESPLTAELIEKLSSIMRYFLEQGPKEQISLNAEMDFIRNYIDLEKMRIRYPVKTTIEISENIADVKIPPMLLIPLVENVFKHGIDKREENNYVTIRLEAADHLHFQVSNRMQDQGQNAAGWGIGLNNLEKRLQILYGRDFLLESDHNADQYTSSLIIPL